MTNLPVHQEEEEEEETKNNCAAALLGIFCIVSVRLSGPTALSSLYLRAVSCTHQEQRFYQTGASDC